MKEYLSRGAPPPHHQDPGLEHEAGLQNHPLAVEPPTSPPPGVSLAAWGLGLCGSPQSTGDVSPGWLAAQSVLPTLPGPECAEAGSRRSRLHSPHVSGQPLLMAKLGPQKVIILCQIPKGEGWFSEGWFSKFNEFLTSLIIPEKQRVSITFTQVRAPCAERR